MLTRSGRPRSALLLLMRAVDGGSCDRVREQVEPEVARAVVAVQFELLDLDRMNRNEIPVQTVTLWWGGTDVALQAGVIGQSDCVAGKSAAAAVADAGGQVGDGRGQV